jgi:hypothetical protein
VSALGGDGAPPLRADKPRRGRPFPPKAGPPLAEGRPWAELKLRPYGPGDLGGERRIKEWLERLGKGKTEGDADA